MNRKGIFDVIIWIVLVFIVFIFFAAWMYGFNLMTTQLVNIQQPEGSLVNLSEAAENTFGQINAALPALRWIALVIAIAMLMSILISNFFVKAHPVFFIVYVLITAVAVVFSVYVSNAYESILTAQNPLTVTLQSFGAMDYLMLNLPIWTTIIGILGAIFLFIGITLDRESGGGLPI